MSFHSLHQCEINRKITDSEAGVMCLYPFLWNNDIQSLQKLPRRKSFRDCACNLIRKLGNPSPWHQVAPFPFNLMPSPRQNKLRLENRHNRHSTSVSVILGLLASCCISLSTSSLQFLDISSMYLVDIFNPRVVRPLYLFERTAEGSGACEG